MNPPAARSFNFWPWLPLLVIGVAAIANIGMIMAAKRVAPQKVEEQAYAASIHFDSDKAAAEAFTARGLRLVITTPDTKTLHLVIDGNTNGSVNGLGEVRLYRPDAPADDRRVEWADVTKSLTIPLTRQGLWRIDLRLSANDGERLAAKTVIDTLGGR